MTPRHGRAADGDGGAEAVLRLRIVSLEPSNKLVVPPHIDGTPLVVVLVRARHYYGTVDGDGRAEVRRVIRRQCCQQRAVRVVYNNLIFRGRAHDDHTVNGHGSAEVAGSINTVRGTCVWFSRLRYGAICARTNNYKFRESATDEPNRSPAPTPSNAATTSGFAKGARGT